MIEPKFNEVINEVNKYLSKPIKLKESFIPKLLKVNAITLNKSILVNPDRPFGFMSLLHEITHILDTGEIDLSIFITNTKVTKL